MQDFQECNCFTYHLYTCSWCREQAQRAAQRVKVQEGLHWLRRVTRAGLAIALLRGPAGVTGVHRPHLSGCSGNTDALRDFLVWMGWRRAQNCLWASLGESLKPLYHVTSVLSERSGTLGPTRKEGIESCCNENQLGLLVRTQSECC